MHNKCFVKNCCTVRSKSITLFRASQKSGRLERWKDAIPPENGELSENSCICELHFEPKYAPRFLEIHYADHIDYYPKSQISLTKDAVPTIFDEKTMEKRRMEIHNDILLRNKSKVSVVLAHNENDIVSISRVSLPCSSRSVLRNIENIPVPVPDPALMEEKTAEVEEPPVPTPMVVDLTRYDFETLKSEISQINLPIMWSYSVYRDLTVMLIKWNFNFRSVIKQIFINSNLECKVFIDRDLATIDPLPVVDGLPAIEKIVKVVDDLPTVPKYDFGKRRFSHYAESTPITLHDFYEVFKNRVHGTENNNSMVHLR